MFWLYKHVRKHVKLYKVNIDIQFDTKPSVLIRERNGADKRLLGLVSSRMNCIYIETLEPERVQGSKQVINRQVMQVSNNVQGRPRKSHESFVEV